MKSEFRVTKVSVGTGPAIHASYDQCPESPDGTRVAYFQFDDEVPGPGKVIVADREGPARSVGNSPYGSGHVGARPVWLDDERLAYTIGGQGGPRVVLCRLFDNERRTMSGAVRTYSPVNSQALYSTEEYRCFGCRADEEAVFALDIESTEVHRLLSREAAVAAHPRRDEITDLESMRFARATWSPDGSRFFIVFHSADEAPGTPLHEARLKSLFLVDARAHHLRYFRECGEDPAWTPDGKALYMYVDLMDGEHAAVVYPADGSGAGPLLHKGPGRHGSLSPDGEYFLSELIDVPEPGSVSIVRYEVGTEKPEPLAVFSAVGTMAERGCHVHPVWSRDGSRVYFNCDEGGMPQLYAVDL
ncbi:MAG: hypothetical protein PVJ27_00665 [Candidatus Brocadiaceae bacterium]